MSDAMTTTTAVGEKPWPHSFVELVESGDVSMLDQAPSAQRSIGTWGTEYLWDQADGQLTLAVHVHRGRSLGSLLMFDGDRYVCSVRVCDLPSEVGERLLAAVLFAVESPSPALQLRQWDEDFLGMDIAAR